MHYVRFTTIFTLLIGLMFLNACKKESDSTEPVQELGKLVKTITVGESSPSSTRQYPGKVIAGQKVDLAFQVSGPLIEFQAIEGKVVQKGEVLAQIDPRDFQLDLDRANVNLVKTKQNYKRTEALLVKNFVAEITYDRAKAEYETAIADTATAQKAFNDTYLNAPFMGIVANTYVENFQYVISKQRILSLQNIDTVDIIVDLPEQVIISTDSEKHRKGVHGKELPNVKVIFNAIPNRNFTVILKEYATQADPVTQTFKITLTMPTPTDVLILPGMSATIFIAQDAPDEKQLFIPAHAALIDEGGQYYCWTVDPITFRTSKRTITVGEFNGESINVRKGLDSGEIVIVAGFSQITDNMKVRIE